MNDTYEIDGHDANGCTGITWAIGGRHDRPWGLERPIFDMTRYTHELRNEFEAKLMAE